MSSAEAQITENKSYFDYLLPGSIVLPVENLEEYGQIYDQEEIDEILDGNAKIIHPSIASILLKKTWNQAILKQYHIESPNLEVRNLAHKAMGFDRIILEMQNKDWDKCINVIEKVKASDDPDLAGMAESRMQHMRYLLLQFEMNLLDSLMYFDYSRPLL